MDEKESLSLESKKYAEEILTDAEQRASELINEAKDMATTEAERLIDAAKSEIEREVVRQGIRNSEEAILRVIEFPPEYQQAGISILSYFSEVLKQKVPDTEASVRIEQIRNKVKLIIDTSSGDREIIEKTLEEFGEVIHGRLAPKEFFDDGVHVMKLQNKLELASLELRMTKQLLEATNTHTEKRITSLEKEVDRLHSLIGDSFSQTASMHTAFNRIISKNENDEVLIKALTVIEKTVAEKSPGSEQESIKSALETIRDQKPGVLTELYDILKGTASGATGNVIASWIMAILNTLPK